MAAELHFATIEADWISLTSKNASAISVRAGQQAAGFKAITVFIDELASTITHQAKGIAALAIKLSRVAVKQRRCSDCIQRIQKAQDLGAKADHIADLSAILHTNQTKLDELNSIFSNLWQQLEAQLENTQKELRSTAIIATSSKVEALNAGVFMPQLNTVAENIESAASIISTHLKKSQQLLNQVH